MVLLSYNLHSQVGENSVSREFFRICHLIS